jgi:serine/threonine protein kinase/tetratricopeptide (TPR) repeat protein
MLGPYKLLSLLGRGGMGEVYLAQDTKLDRKVALKILPADAAANQERMRRFLQEAKAAAALNHQNIAHIYEIGEAVGVNFIAMEFIDGQTLREYIHRGQTELAKLLRHLQHVAGGLAKAHAAGIVHRDLKPDNIMITRDDHAKILDFGLAKLIEPQQPAGISEDASELATAILQQHSSPGVILGTPGYMSPEQAQGKTNQIDHRSDIFSFGCILYESVTGHRAFEGKDSIDTLNKVIREPAPPISDFRSDAPNDLQRIVRRCLAKDPEDRYQTIKDVAIELRELRREMAGNAGFDITMPPSSAAATLGSAGSAATVPSEATRSTASRLAVAALAVMVIAIAAVGVYLLSRLGEQESIGSLAVLPFVNVSGDPSAEYLSDGITESIISALSQLSGLRVMSSNSVFRYKGRAADAQEVGRELGVRAVVVGRVVQRGDGLSISAELIDTRDSSQLWGEQYNRKSADILAVQEEIARQISDKLRLRLSGEDKGRLAKRYTESTEAYELYLKGRFHQNKRTQDDLKRSIDYFKQAVAKDPNYALAHSGISDSYSYLGNHGFLPPKEVSPQAKDSALKALEIDDRLAEAHTSLAYVKVNYDWDWAGAEREFKRAIELNPSYTRAHSLLAAYLSGQGRFEEAFAEMNRALELDPLSIYDNTNLGWHLHKAGRVDEAIEQFRKTIEMDQSYAQAHDWLGQVYDTKQMYEAAISEFKEAIVLYGGAPSATAALGYGYAVAGRKDEARRCLRELQELGRERYVSSYDVAVILTGLGENDQAFVRLGEAYERRDGWLAFWLKVDPRLDPLRSDPRFQDLLRRVGHTT